jgi:hypothetical protein
MCRRSTRGCGGLGDERTPWKSTASSPVPRMVLVRGPGRRRTRQRERVNVLGPSGLHQQVLHRFSPRGPTGQWPLPNDRSRIAGSPNLALRVSAAPAKNSSTFRGSKDPPFRKRDPRCGCDGEDKTFATRNACRGSRPHNQAKSRRQEIRGTRRRVLIRHPQRRPNAPRVSPVEAAGRTRDSAAPA